MGEVYKARDTRLDRVVAIKVLPAHFADNIEARQRFDREAKVISSLSHPNICTLFDVGHQGGIDYLVMEYLEGETLASRLTRGSLPVGEALHLAIQIADALQKAHRQNLVHRDLKPGNIMLTKAGAKLLDFGLAKLGQESNSVPGDGDVTSSAQLTGEGSILGTLQYMSPEQLEGKNVDQRSDIFAFGAILYEMISGHRAFGGDSQASIIASILKEQPRSIRELKPMFPRSLVRTVEQCLEKNPDNRWQSAGDLARELQWILKDSQRDEAHEDSTPLLLRPASRSKWLWGGPLIAILATIGVMLMKISQSSPPRQESQRFIIPTDSLESDFSTPAVISPDGKLIAYTDAGRLQLREMNQFSAEAIGGSRELSGIFWSPDSRIIAFGQDQRLWRYDVVTGEKRLMCDLPETGRILGGCWNEVGDIYLAVWRGGLYHTSATGGTPTLVIPSDSVLVHDFHTPQFLPDGKTVLLYLHAKKTADNGIVLVHNGASEMAVVRKVPLATGVTYSPTGHLLYTLTSGEGEIWALPFSASDLQETGEPFLAIHGGQFPSVSRNGNMVYFGIRRAQAFQLVIVSRDGKEVDTVGGPASNMSTPVFSPDGGSILYTAEDNGKWILWKHNLVRRTSERLITDSNIAIRPSWFPSGNKFIFTRILGVSEGTIDVFDLSSGRVTDSICEGMFGALSPDGHYVVFSRDVQGNFDLWHKDLWKKSAPEPLLRTPDREQDAVVSRDGKWFAYGSNASGDYQIYLRTFPDAKSPVQVSADGGWYPFWHPSGDTLFWVTDSAVFESSVKWAQTPQLGMPVEALNATRFRLKVNSRYSAAGENAVALSPDGQRFALVTRVGGEGEESELMVVLNWTDELKPMH
jgi:serine/threonine protein kinase/sugar lactone lactonase YvrE